MKSVTDHLAISSSFTASYPIADSSHFFSPIFQKVTVPVLQWKELCLNLLILSMTEPVQKL